MTAKTDMERVALFKEMGYVSIGDKYKSLGSMEFNASATKGRQMLPGGHKTRCATAAGYFTEFSRAFEKEAYSNVIDLRRKQRIADGKRIIGKAWMPPQGPKDQSGTGSVFGTFAGPIDHFSGIVRGQKVYQAPRKNILTSPAKLGSGYGYVDVTLSKYPTYQSDKYGKGEEAAHKENEKHKSLLLGRSEFKPNPHSSGYFDPNPYHEEKTHRPVQKSAPPRLDVKPFKPSSPTKRDGGMKAGTFDPFPTYPSNPYQVLTYKRPVHVVNSSGKVFVPNPGLKSAPVSSIIDSNVRRSVNVQNYKTTSSVVGY